MSILNAMYSGVSGLNAEGEALGVVGDNVANSSTVGFKGSRAQFEDVLSGAVGTRSAVGGGTHMARAQQIFAQGSLVNTGQATDLALTGEGFFVVKGQVSGVSGEYYTRAGQTTLDKDGMLVNQGGLNVEGYKANTDGTFSSQMGPIQVPTGDLPPKATAKLAVTANLDASATVPAAWDPANPAGTSNFSSGMTVYDSLGKSHAVNVYFSKTAAGSWDYHSLVDGADVAGGTPGVNTEIASGNMTFTSGGALDTVTASGGTVDFTDAKPGQTIAFDFGKPIAAGGTGVGGTTQFSSPSSVSSQSQDGYASGSFTGVAVDQSGVVNASYSNGQRIEVAQLAVAKFRSNDGLGRAGHNLWIATKDSGPAALGAAGTGGRASVVAGALEQSNVDVTTQLVDMISHQRAFQANSKTITTADEMLQEVVNLKR